MTVEMRRMSRLEELEYAVETYLSHLQAVEAGSMYDIPYAEFWLEQMRELTTPEGEN